MSNGSFIIPGLHGGTALNMANDFYLKFLIHLLQKILVEYSVSLLRLKMFLNYNGFLSYSEHLSSSERLFCHAISVK
jgi:hypothetical protein